MEDKVKEQLEAANPEPVIEEVVSGFPKSLFSIMPFGLHVGLLALISGKKTIQSLF